MKLQQGDWVYFRDNFWVITGIHLKDISLANLITGDMGSWSTNETYIKIPKADFNAVLTQILELKEKSNVST